MTNDKRGLWLLHFTANRNQWDHPLIEEHRPLTGPEGWPTSHLLSEDHPSKDAAEARLDALCEAGIVNPCGTWRMNYIGPTSGIGLASDAIL